MIGDVHPDRLLPVDRGGRGGGRATQVQRDDQLFGQTVLFGGHRLWRQITETADVQRDGRHQLQRRVGAHGICQIGGLGAVAVDQRAEPGCAEFGDLGPDFQRAKPA